MLSFASCGINSIDAPSWSRLLLKTTQQLLYSFSGFPRVSDFTYYGMNKIQNNYFPYLNLEHGPSFSIHITIFFFRRLFPTQKRKKEPAFRTKKKLTGSSSSTPETQSTLCGCLRFFSSFLSHTAHKTALDTSAARKKVFAVHLIIRTRLVYTTDQIE